jgi:hypothetical protein
MTPTKRIDLAGSDEQLRDKDPRRFRGKAVLKAVSSINKVLSSLAIGADVLNQRKLDAAMWNADAILDKSRLAAKPIGHYGTEFSNKYRSGHWKSTASSAVK